MNLCSENLEICSGQPRSKIRPYIVDWIAYDLILGKRWPTEMNPLIDGARNRMRIKIKQPGYNSGGRS